MPDQHILLLIIKLPEPLQNNLKPKKDSLSYSLENTGLFLFQQLHYSITCGLRLFYSHLSQFCSKSWYALPVPHPRHLSCTLGLGERVKQNFLCKSSHAPGNFIHWSWQLVNINTASCACHRDKDSCRSPWSEYKITYSISGMPDNNLLLFALVFSLLQFYTLVSNWLNQSDYTV